MLFVFAGERDLEKLLSYIVFFAVFTFGVQQGLILLTRKKQAEIDKALDQDED